MQVSFYVPQTASFLRKCIVITFHHRKMHVLDVRHFFQVDKYAWTERRVFTEVGRQAEIDPTLRRVVTRRSEQPGGG